jgi:hypothetical protein
VRLCRRPPPPTQRRRARQEWNAVANEVRATAAALDMSRDHKEEL